MRASVNQAPYQRAFANAILFRQVHCSKNAKACQQQNGEAVIFLLEKIKRLCKEKGVSLQEASDACGFGQKSIYTWGESLPASIERVKRLADYFGVTVDYLLSGGGDGET